jgi:hypothetical protein
MMTHEERFELTERIAQLPLAEQFYLLEDILRRIRHQHFTDYAALEREMEEMANDPEIQRVLRGEDLTEAPRDAQR